MSSMQKDDGNDSDVIVVDHSCMLCREGTALVDEILRYAGVLTPEFPFVCETCNESFKTERSLHSHAQAHATSKKKVRKRITSKKEKVGPQEYAARKKKPPNKKEYHVCKICNWTFIHFESFRRHCFKHPEMEFHACPVCNKKYMHKSSVARHLATHSQSKRL